jgi:hypothetical protein
VQRYGMLEKPGASIPTPAIKATTFVGRENEIKELTKAHDTFVAFHQENQDRKKISQWTLIKGEPGTGKTALINKHLANIDEKSDALSHSQIKLRLLNQVGHNSEVTGLASLLQSIQAEAERLTQYYQANQSFVQKKISEKSVAYKDVKADVKNLKDSRKGLFKIIKNATEFVVDVAGLGTPYKAAISAIDTFTLGRNHSQTGDALQQESSTDKKQEQFDQLNMALRYLSDIAQVIDKKAEQMPVLLFVDDLQWVDELTSEFILAHLLPAFPIELLFTARGSDSETSYKLAVEEQKHSPYKLAIFDAAQLSIVNITSEKKPNTLVENKLITLQPKIIIKGMDHETLSELIKLTYQNASKEQTETIASAVMNALSVEKITETTQVVTLFAIETLNLISDPAFYCKNKELTPLIIQPKKGVYEIKLLEKQVLINTVENIFTLLRDAHTQAFMHDSLQDSTNSHFTLSSYAVMEERLFIIGQYFNEYSDAAIFSLQLSALIGAPFDSDLVREIILELANVDEGKHPELTPVKRLLKKNADRALSPEHLEVLEEVFEILKRLQGTHNKHLYHHGLFALFLRQQVKYRLITLFHYQSDTNTINQFFRFCSDIMTDWFEQNDKIVVSRRVRSRNELYKQTSYVNLFELAYCLDNKCWARDYTSHSIALADLFIRDNQSNKAIKLSEKAKVILEVLHYTDPKEWAIIYAKSVKSLAVGYKELPHFITTGGDPYEPIKSPVNIKMIELLKLSLNILELKLDEGYDLQAAITYYNTLEQLAIIYKQARYRAENASVKKKIQSTLKQFYRDDVDNWAVFYSEKLICLSYESLDKKRNDKALSFAVASYQITNIPHKYSKVDIWTKAYFMSLNCLAFCYLSEGNNNKAITYTERGITISKLLVDKMLEDDKLDSETNGYYMRSFGWLATMYNESHNNEKGLFFKEKQLEYIERFLPSRWNDQYLQHLTELLDKFVDNKQTEEIIRLKEKYAGKIGQLFSDKEHSFAYLYIEILVILADGYKKAFFLEKAISTEIEILKITQKYWGVLLKELGTFSKYYTVRSRQIKLASSYEDNNQYAEAITLYEELKSLAEGNKEENSNYSIIILQMLSRLEEYQKLDEAALKHQSDLISIASELWMPHNYAWLLGVWGNTYHDRGLANQAKDKVSQMHVLIQKHQLEGFECYDELITQYI